MNNGWTDKIVELEKYKKMWEELKSWYSSSSSSKGVEVINNINFYENKYFPKEK